MDLYQLEISIKLVWRHKTLNTINRNTLEKLIREMSFYNFNDLNSNNNRKIVVKFQNKINSITYSDLQFNEGVEIFEYKKNIIIEFIKKVLRVINEENCILRKYNERWVVNQEESKELVSIIKSNGINNNFNGGLLVHKNDQLVKLFIESVLRYNSFIQIIFSKSQIIISPSDHMDIFFEGSDINELKRVIDENIKSFGNDVLILKTDN